MGRKPSFVKKYGDHPQNRKSLSKSAHAVFSSKMLSEKACRNWLVNELFMAKKIHCPTCKELIRRDTVEKYITCENPSSKVRCGGCGKWFRFWAGTPLRGRHVKPEKVYMISLLFSQGASLKDIAKRSDRHECCLPETIRIITQALDDE